MSNIAKGLCWAAAMLLAALGNRLGLIEDAAAKVLSIVLPIITAMSLNGRHACWPRRKEA